MDTFIAQTVTSLDAEHLWLRELRAGHSVELLVYGERMTGRIQQVSPDSLVMRIPVEDQIPDVRRHTVYGTATVSLESGAARVPVSARASGDQVRLQFTGHAELLQRRQHVRVSVQLPVSLRWVAPETDPDRADSYTLDLSVGGLRIAAVRTVWPNAGSLVLVELRMPTGVVQGSALVIGLTPAYELRLAFNEPGPLTVDQVLSLAH